MEYGKYIIVEVNSTELAICFDCIIDHSAIAGTFCHNVISAGMFAVGGKPSDDDPEDIDVSVFGHSISLDMKPRRGIDERLIKRILRKNWGI